jgi:predicted dehydrogenase
VAARTAEAARKFADNLGIERSTGDYHDLLADGEISAVHICTPNALHFPMAQAARKQASMCCARSPSPPPSQKQRR